MDLFEILVENGMLVEICVGFLLYIFTLKYMMFRWKFGDCDLCIVVMTITYGFVGILTGKWIKVG